MKLKSLIGRKQRLWRRFKMPNMSETIRKMDEALKRMEEEKVVEAI